MKTIYDAFELIKEACVLIDPLDIGNGKLKILNDQWAIGFPIDGGDLVSRFDTHAFSMVVAYLCTRRTTDLYLLVAVNYTEGNIAYGVTSTSKDDWAWACDQLEELLKTSF